MSGFTKLIPILLLALVYFILRRIYAIYQGYQCFDDEILKDFFNGRLNREEDLRRSVVNHLGVCEKCQQRLYDLQEGDGVEQHLVD